MSGCPVCAEASDVHESIIVAAEVRPDIIVMDLSIPKFDGIDVTMRLRKTLPGVEVLILTMHESDQLGGQELRAGARGYLHKRAREIGRASSRVHVCQYV